MKMSEFIFKEEEIRKFISPALKEFREFTANLCRVGNELHTEKITKGSEEWVKAPEPTCERGEFIGDIHTHTEEKGVSDVDIFQEIQWNLNKERQIPRMSCVIYPKYNKQDILEKMALQCDYIKEFGEKEILEIPKPFIIEGKRLERKKEEIDFFKRGSPRQVGADGGWAGMIARHGFISDMRNIRLNLIEKGFIDTFEDDIIKIKKAEKNTALIDIKDEVKIRFKSLES